MPLPGVEDEDLSTNRAQLTEKTDGLFEEELSEELQDGILC